MSILDTLITDRVPGAAYGWRDMNRVAEAMECVAERLRSYGWGVAVTPQRFTREDFPSQAVFDHYLLQLRTLHDALALFATTPPVPDVNADRPYMTVQEANDIEKILLDIEGLLTLMAGSFLRCGAPGVFCGACGLPTEGGYFALTWEELDARSWSWDEWDTNTWTQLSYRKR